MPVSLRTFYWTFLASAVSSICGACLLAALKSVFRSRCIDGNVASSNESLLFQVAAATLVLSVIAILSNVALLLSEPLAQGGWAAAGSIFHNWQPSYFVIVSCQKIVLTALVIEDASRDLTLACVSVSVQRYLLAAAFAWNVALLFVGVSAICFDVDRDINPALRRWFYCVFELCSLLDAIGSFAWGNMMASLVSISIASFSFTLDQHVTSTICSQLVISTYFLVHSLRTGSGCAWHFPPLRFELKASDAMEISLPQMNDSVTEKPLVSAAASEIRLGGCIEESTANAQAHATKPDESSHQANKDSHATGPLISRLRHRWFRFQRRQIGRCRVFFIPCVVHPLLEAARGPRDPLEGLEITRPLLTLRWLRHLHRFAEAHTNIYIATITLLGVASFSCQLLLKTNEEKGQGTLVFNSAVFILGLGFISSKRNTLDKVAAIHVISSFRFLVLALFLAVMVALGARTSHLGTTSPWQTVSGAVLSLIFLTCALLDCSPHLPAFSQTCISVLAPASVSFLFIVQSLHRRYGASSLDFGLTMKFCPWDVGIVIAFFNWDRFPCVWRHHTSLYSAISFC